MMKPKLLLRVAAGCLLFFALGHSVGHFTRHEVKDTKAREVLKQMAENKFDMFGQLRSYEENYTGMSLNLILTLLAFASILWILSSLVEKQPAFVRKMLIPITMCEFGFSVTSFFYFFPLPAITCLLAFIVSVWAIFKLKDKSTDR